MWTQARNLPCEEEREISVRRETVAFYRQITSADVETNCKPSAASIEEDMSALIT